MIGARRFVRFVFAFQTSATMATLAYGKDCLLF
jgi:hypothetical protein